MTTNHTNLILSLLCLIICTVPLQAYAQRSDELNQSLDYLLEELSPPSFPDSSSPTESDTQTATEIPLINTDIDNEKNTAPPPEKIQQEPLSHDPKTEPITPPVPNKTPDIIETELSAPIGPFRKSENNNAKIPPSSPLPKPEEASFTNKVQLEGLNKITARTSPLIATINNSIFFGTLEIQVERCWKSAPEDLPENKALIRVWEKIPGELRKLIFYGWMFSSSPSLLPLEHPVYDITVTECIKDE